MRGVLAVPTPCVNHRTPRQVQTGGGHSATPLSIQLSLGQFPSSLGYHRPSSSWSPLIGGRQSAAVPDWSSCGSQYLGEAATWCPQGGLFARRHMLETVS